ncbi:hypothetical protein HHK36_004308 [Tetracentron sinense]|uniref:SUEL-type lectin domain-containing protein n=1 Tax=Tetracentron sinense TaxID=13715 RepID=A0A834ZU61_TETSI|nr:hypothetical protein HHK36_004308 [Tetracentron sinense]
MLKILQAVVDAPPGDEPIGLDMIYMGKGLAWLNGEEIGRYWPRTSSIHDECPHECNYRGKFSPNKCSTGCGEPTQRWYHIPRSWFRPSGNILVIFEEKGGDPTKITFLRRQMKGVCALVSEDYPSVDLESWQNDNEDNSNAKATLHLKCPTNNRISAVKFASFGTPSGTCGFYRNGDCHDPNSISVVEKVRRAISPLFLTLKFHTTVLFYNSYHIILTLVLPNVHAFNSSSLTGDSIIDEFASMLLQVCLNKNDCVIALSEENFNKELCPSLTKKLAVEAVCS